jgi:hypothetical protein
MKFKVGDLIKSKGGSLGPLKIVRIVAVGGVPVAGPWNNGDDKVIVPENSYILEDENGKWTWAYVGGLSSYNLVKRAEQKPVQESKKDLSSPFPTLREFLGV